MKDIFDSTILCNKCETKMTPAEMVKNGFTLRVLHCKKCGEKLVHPIDEQNYNQFISLRQKNFNVKLRMVGNSYAVSIPKEIVDFINHQEKIMDELVNLCFEDFGRITLNFKKLE